MAGGNAPVHAHSLLLAQGIPFGYMAVAVDDGGDYYDVADTADHIATVDAVLALDPGPAADKTLQTGTESPQWW